MNESFQEQKREQLPQAEASIQDRKERINEDSEYLRANSVHDLGQTAMNLMSIEHLNLEESISGDEEESSMEFSNERMPIMDTAESLVERQEKLKKGIKSLLAVHHTLVSQYLLRL